MARRESTLDRARATISGGTDSEESDSTVRANPQPSPRYLYYRLFTDDIAIPSKQPASSGNSYVGRVRANSIAPPHTVLLIERRLCSIESISDYSNSTLFFSGSSRSPMDDGEHLSILTPGSSGSTSEKPIELIINLSRREIDKRSANIVLPQPRYIYYNLYTEEGEIPAKHPINSNADDCPSLARIDNYLVPPPHTLNSIIRCISYVEGFSYNGWHQMFTDIASQSPTDDNDVLILKSGDPGSMPEKPLAFVRAADMTTYGTTKKYCHNETPRFLRIDVGCAVYTDGVVRREAVPGPIKFESSRHKTPATSEARIYTNVYRVRNTAGQCGYVRTENVSLSY